MTKLQNNYTTPAPPPPQKSKMIEVRTLVTLGWGWLPWTWKGHRELPGGHGDALYLDLGGGYMVYA